MIRVLPLANRRVAVVLHVLSFPLAFMSTAGLGLLSSIAVLIGLIAFAGTAYYLYHNTGLWQFGNAPDGQLDERQVQTRNQAYRYAYMIISTILVCLLAYLMLATDFRWPLPVSSSQVNPVFWSFWLLVLTLPSAVLAWTEQDI